MLHRDLKPQNILINSALGIRICDLGLARTSQEQDGLATGYVTTRWFIDIKCCNKNVVYCWYDSPLVLLQLIQRLLLQQGREPCSMLVHQTLATDTCKRKERCGDRRKGSGKIGMLGRDGNITAVFVRVGSESFLSFQEAMTRPTTLTGSRARLLTMVIYKRQHWQRGGQQ